MSLLFFMWDSRNEKVCLRNSMLDPLVGEYCQHLPFVEPTAKFSAKPIQGRWWKDLLKWLKIITSSRTPASTRYWTNTGPAAQTLGQHQLSTGSMSRVFRDGLSQAVTHSGEGPQQRRDIEHVLVKCWPIVNDAGPTLKQHKSNVTCLLGGGGGSWRQSQCYYTARWGGDRPHCV